jgi:hypothetical protein
MEILSFSFLHRNTGASENTILHARGNVHRGRKNQQIAKKQPRMNGNNIR